MLAYHEEGPHAPLQSVGWSVKVNIFFRRCMTNVSGVVQCLFLGSSTATEWAPLFAMGYVACPDGYLEGCLIYLKGRANPASKQKPKVEPFTGLL